MIWRYVAATWRAKLSLAGETNTPEAILRVARAQAVPVLKLDLDGKQLHTLDWMRRRLDRANRVLKAWLVEESPSGRGWHQWVIVYPHPTSALEMVALQLLLGSDPLREAYNINRARAVDFSGHVPDWWRARWNVFYRRAT